MQSDYPREWPDISLEVKRLTGWRCVRCRHPDDPQKCDLLHVNRGLLPCDEYCRHSLETQKQRVLTVHHLDGIKANCLWWNLAVLCQVCHLVIQARLRMDQQFLFDQMHSHWLMPYLLGRDQAAEGINRAYESVIIELQTKGNDLWPHPYSQQPVLTN